MAKKAKKPAKVAKSIKKLAKPSAPKAKKPAKVAAKPSNKVKIPASKLVKKVALKTAKKIAEKLLPKKKVAPAPSKPPTLKPTVAKATTDKLKKPAKDAVLKTAGKPVDKLVTKLAETKTSAKAPVKGTPETLKGKKGSTPKTLQAKGSEVDTDPVAVDAKVESKTLKDIILTDAEGRILCRVKDCDQPSVVESYCRYHYLFFWKKIQNRKKILSEGKLEQYIEELTSRYPLKFLELIRKDLSSEPDFMSAIQELDIDEASTDVDSFEDENFMEEVRGISSVDTERVDDEY
jgi:hypothetical protein